MVMPEPLRIVYFGTPAFAVPTLRKLLTSRHTIAGVVSQPDRPKGRGHRVAATPTKELATLCGVPVLQPTKLRDDRFMADVVSLRPDLGVVAAYGRILPDALLRLPRLGMINVHASLLPKYRGAAPVHRAVMAGEGETGVTIMRVVQALDAGPILATVTRPIGIEETSVDVERALAELGASLLLDVVDRIAGGDVSDTPQDDSRATYAAKISKSEGAVDWSLPARRIHDLIRGLQPWPLVAVSIDGLRCLVHRSAVGGDTTIATWGQPPFPTDIQEAVTSAPGTIVAATGDRLSVATGDGGLLHILQIQPDGRRVMTAREFLSGHTIAVGTRLTSAPPA
jgi:methionyl-tRNA formyltransferase